MAHWLLLMASKVTPTWLKRCRRLGCVCLVRIQTIVQLCGGVELDCFGRKLDHVVVDVAFLNGVVVELFALLNPRVTSSGEGIDPTW